MTFASGQRLQIRTCVETKTLLESWKRTRHLTCTMAASQYLRGRGLNGECVELQISQRRK